MLFGLPSYVHSDRRKAFESEEFCEFLRSWNIRKSRTTLYHPQGNGQNERFNGTIWRTILLRLEQQNKDLTQWREELDFALSNIRALPSRSIDFQSPHERFFGFARRSTLEPICSLLDSPTVSAEITVWLIVGNPAYAKRQVRKSKADPLVDKVTIIEILSPYVVRVQYNATGRRTTISSRNLSRCPQQDEEYYQDESENDLDPNHDNEGVAIEPANNQQPTEESDKWVSVERQRRLRKPPQYLCDYNRQT